MTFDDYLIIAIAAVPAIVFTVASITSIIDDFNHSHAGDKNE